MKPRLIIGNKNYSSWSLRAWLLLKEAGIDFDEHRILLDTDTTAHEIAEFEAGRTVPILQIGDTTIWDTLAISETIAERWPDKKLWPEDADLRATIADAMFAPVVLRFRTYGINLPDSAGFYPQRVLESDAMQEWLAAAECEIEVIDADEAGQ
jgi:glutathione S-transferase